MFNSKTLQKPANPETAVLSRRTPCFGNGVVIYLKDQFPELNEFLINLLAQLIRILDPQKPTTGPRKLPGLIKVKTLHGACTGIPPYSNREDYLSFFNKPMDEGGFGGEATLEAMSKKLQTYLKQNSPTLVPASLEYKESDGSILARFKFTTHSKEERPVALLKNELDPHGVLPQWAPESLRDTTVIVMLCTTTSPNADQIKQIRALIPELGQTTPESEKFIAFGAQPITTFTVLREYNKRTLTIGGKDHDHASIYANVQENAIIKPDNTAAYKI